MTTQKYRDVESTLRKLHTGVDI